MLLRPLLLVVDAKELWKPWIWGWNNYKWTEELCVSHLNMEYRELRRLPAKWRGGGVRDLGL